MFDGFIAADAPVAVKLLIAGPVVFSIYFPGYILLGSLGHLARGGYLQDFTSDENISPQEWHRAFAFSGCMLALGLVLGVLAPVYFDAEGWWRFMFECLAIASLQLAFAGLFQRYLGMTTAAGGGALIGAILFNVAYVMSIGSPPLVAKTWWFLLLLLAGGLFGLGAFEALRNPYASGTKRMAGIVGCVLSLLELLNKAFALWEKVLGQT